jgi:hypothetical protein
MSTIRLIPKSEPVVINTSLGVAGVDTPAFLNGTGVTVNQGMFVYVDATPEFQLANAAAVASSGGVGFLTANTAAGGSSTLRVGGLSPYFLEAGDPGASTGDMLFLSSAEAGKLTTVAPAAGVGVVIVQAGTHLDGEVLINIRVTMEYT